MKKEKPKCTICDDTGYFTNPFDQTYKCSCMDKKKKQNKKAIPVELPVMQNLPEVKKAKRYKCLLCGRDKFIRRTPHNCVSGYRKRHIKWEEITEENDGQISA